MNEAFRKQCPPMRRVLEKLAPQHKVWVATDISRLLTVGRKMSKMLETYPLDTHNTEAAIIALGFATAQVSYINRITERIKELSGSRFYNYPVELYDLKEQCNNQAETCQQMVYAIMAKEIPVPTPKQEATPV